MRSSERLRSPWRRGLDVVTLSERRSAIKQIQDGKEHQVVMRKIPRWLVYQIGFVVEKTPNCDIKYMQGLQMARLKENRKLEQI